VAHPLAGPLNRWLVGWLVGWAEGGLSRFWFAGLVGWSAWGGLAVSRWGWFVRLVSVVTRHADDTPRRLELGKEVLENPLRRY
jgi:hypothetical protein